MPEPTCPICATPAQGRATYCSERCKWTASNRKRYKRDSARRCPGCDSDIGDRQATTKYCSNACRRWVRNGNSSLRAPATVCAHCADAISTPRAGKLFCSVKCKLAAGEPFRDRDDAARYLRERERRIAYATRYAAQHPEVGQRAKRRRKALLAGAGVFEISARDWRRMCQRFHGRCCYCGEARPLTMDHVVPVIRGGRHSIGNLLPACASCNASKNRRTLMEWRVSRKKGGDCHPLEAD